MNAVAAEPRLLSVTVPATGRWLQMAYAEWGAADNPDVVVCVHGLTRSGRDFDVLARHLAGRFRVVCPDVMGRGRSDWLPQAADYSYPRYLQDLAILLARLQVAQVHWVGTSMGGILGLMLAAMGAHPLRSLVLNDVGMHIPAAALAQIGSYVGRSPSFGTFADAARHLAKVNAGFGQLDDAQWTELARHTTRQDSDGRWRVCYDPAIGLALQGVQQDIDLSAWWRASTLPTLILRGAGSALLTPATVAAMQAVRPDVRAVTFPDCGHAPALQDPAQVAEVLAFLGEVDGSDAGPPQRPPFRGGPHLRESA